MQLPPELRKAIGEQLEGVSRNLLAERAGRISAHYRSGGRSAQAMRDELDALAYAVVRMPATYAAVRNVLTRLQQRSPSFEPANLVDLGAGPGTAGWAAADLWPALASITAIDANPLLLQLGSTLAASASSPAMRAAQSIQTTLTASLQHAADLVVANYAFAEIPANDIRGILASAWAGCTGAIAIIEPGTPGGYEHILLYRNVLLGLGAKILAPCPHQLSCPLIAPDWCHFVQRVERSRDHMLVKSAEAPWEDEKFSYLIAVREHVFSQAEKQRVLAPPEISKGGVTVKLCQVDGRAASVQIRKRDQAAFKTMKKKDWGDEAEFVIAPEQSR